MARYTTHHGKRVSPAHATMLAAYERETGSAIYINQGARTIPEQAAFYFNYRFRGGPLAAKPWGGAPHIKWGKQNHAMDINAPQPAHGVADFYRRHSVPVAFNVSGEAWHMDTLDEAALIRAAAKLGGDTGDKPLKQGQTGPSVVKLKKLLWDVGLRNFSGRKNSNRYDPFFSKWTAAAVRQFQRQHGLTADGRVGPKTWNALRKAAH